ncbi:MAG TPA: hypothetical protein VJT84_08480 [Gaiellaceae bacterium]|nr:hypothetical protein [Gaiellaceae bacterium]
MKQGLSMLGVFVLAAALGGGASAGSSAPGAKSSVRPVVAVEALVSGTFAGKATGGPAVGVVVVAEKPTAAQPRTISVYVCNGSSLSVWLSGKTAGNVIDLRSADAQYGVHVNLTAQAASGKFGISGGSGFSFSVPRALGPAGLFDVNVVASGLLRGTSTAGGSLTGRAGAGGKLLARGTVTATVTADSKVLKLTAVARHLTPGAYRWIVLSTGNVWGANKRGPIRGGIGGFVRPTGGKQFRIKASGAGQKGYDDKKCGQLADKFNKGVAQLENAIQAGKDTSNIAKDGNKLFDEIEAHCVMIL